MSKLVINTEKAPAAVGPYSQAIKMDSLIFTSGQLPLDAATNEFVGEGIEEQTSQCLENLKMVLAAAETSLDQVIKMNVYLKNMDDFPMMNQIYETFFKTSLPARSCVQVAKLPKNAKVEMEAVALCPAA